MDFLNGKAPAVQPAQNPDSSLDTMDQSPPLRSAYQRMVSPPAAFVARDARDAHGNQYVRAASTPPAEWPSPPSAPTATEHRTRPSSDSHAGGSSEDQASLLVRLHAARRKYAAQQAALARLEARVRAAAVSDAAAAAAPPPPAHAHELAAWAGLDQDYARPGPAAGWQGRQDRDAAGTAHRTQLLQSFRQSFRERVLSVRED